MESYQACLVDGIGDPQRQTTFIRTASLIESRIRSRRPIEWIPKKFPFGVDSEVNDVNRPFGPMRQYFRNASVEYKLGNTQN